VADATASRVDTNVVSAVSIPRAERSAVAARLGRATTDPSH
jgi:hypothetical protein